MRFTPSSISTAFTPRCASGAAVRVNAVFLALGVNLNGDKELLGLWVAQTEGAKFWLQVVTELKNGVYRISSLLAWMASRAFRRRLKPCSRRPRYNCASCTWCVTV